MLLVALTAVLLALLIVPVGRQMEWGRVYRQTQVLIQGLRPTQPNAINPSVWESARGWVINAYCNICFSPDRPPIAEMYRLRAELDVKLSSQIDLDTLRWIWARLGQTGPDGKHYIEKYDSLMRDCFPAEGTAIHQARREESSCLSL